MWEIKITLDESTTGVGTISGTWTDEDGVFSFSARSTVDEAGQTEFIVLASVARDAWKAKLATEKVLADAATAKANEGVT